MNISFEYYKVFYHVARLGSITLAAKALFLSQPAVSKSVRQLESLLGCELFFRRHKGMDLTPEGEVLYQHVAQACQQLAIGEKKIQAMLDLEGEASISALPICSCTPFCCLIWNASTRRTPKSASPPSP